MSMRPVLVFDALGTLLDTGVFDPLRVSDLVQRAMTATILDAYRPFEELAVEAIGAEAPALMRALPPYPEVPEALAMLQRAGYAMYVLTNGSRESTRVALANAGIAQYFRAVYSAEAIEKYKPHPAVYRTTLVRMNVAPEDAIMIAAHAWDVAGARNHGMRAELVERPGRDLRTVAEALAFFPVTSGLA